MAEKNAPPALAICWTGAHPSLADVIARQQLGSIVDSVSSVWLCYPTMRMCAAWLPRLHCCFLQAHIDLSRLSLSLIPLINGSKSWCLSRGSHHC